MKHCNNRGHKFKDCSFRLTQAREVILDILEHANEHLSADDIYMLVHTSYPDIGLTTVYRTLDLLVKSGIVIKFDFGQGRAKYEFSDTYSKKTHHHHLICSSCQKIIDYADFPEDEIAYIQKAEQGVRQKFNFNIKAHVIHFYGICETCSKKGE